LDKWRNGTARHHYGYGSGPQLRAWRKAQTPPLSGHDAGRWLDLSFMSIYRLEQGTRLPGGKVMRALLARGICTLEDFETPAQTEDA
jgi:hypothetical protein